jgi:hypothetical protein
MNRRAEGQAVTHYEPGGVRPDFSDLVGDLAEVAFSSSDPASDALVSAGRLNGGHANA